MRNTAQVQSLDRGLTILDVLSDGSPELGVTELALRLGVHKSTVFRLLSTLQAHDLVEQNSATEKYRLGYGLVRLSGAVVAEMDLVRAARPLLRGLAGRARETVNLAIPQGDQVVHVDQATPPEQLVSVNWVGKQVPLHCTSNGKVLLAYMDGRERERLLAGPLQRFTPRTITDPRLLERQLSRVPADGYAFTLEELETGLNAVAAPVRGMGGDVVAVVSLSGPSYRVTSQRLPELGELTRHTADAISRRIGYTPGGAA
jgi:IclR family transcriptional regulator, acetate operon repressor